MDTGVNGVLSADEAEVQSSSNQAHHVRGCQAETQSSSVAVKAGIQKYTNSITNTFERLLQS